MTGDERHVVLGLWAEHVLGEATLKRVLRHGVRSFWGEDERARLLGLKDLGVRARHAVEQACERSMESWA